MLRVIHAIENTVLAACLGAMILVAAYQVFARNFFDSGLLWGDSLVKVLVLWVTLVGAMVSARRGEHIRIDVLPRLLPGVRVWSGRVTDLFTFVVCALVAYNAFEFVRYEFQDGTIAFAAVPAWVCEAIIPLGFAVMSARYLVQVFVRP